MNKTSSANAETLAFTFEQNRSSLLSFLLRITCNKEDSEDIAQSAYIKAQENISSFSGRSSLKTWIYKIASNIALDMMRNKKRWPQNVTDICKEAALSDEKFFSESINISRSSEHGKFEIREHIALCFTCVSRSLPLERQLALLLKEVYQFKIDEIAIILSTTEALVKYYLNQGRKTMNDVFDKRCSLINKNGICHQCSELNNIYNPKQDAQVEITKLSLNKAAREGRKDELLTLRTKILQELDPFDSPASSLQLHHLEQNLKVMNAYLENK